MRPGLPLVLACVTFFASGFLLVTALTGRALVLSSSTTTTTTTITSEINGLTTGTFLEPVTNVRTSLIGGPTFAIFSGAVFLIGLTILVFGVRQEGSPTAGRTAG